MRKSPSETVKKDTLNNATHPSTRNNSTQHGIRSDPRLSLLSLPAESLTHVTSFLDPVSLFRLGRTNKALYEHVKDDNTWHRAFVCQFLGISPESDIHHVDAITLRRLEPTWKKEFIARHQTRRRWLRSRSSTVTHIPHYATVSDLHMLSEEALLSSSIQYGIVARSFPLTGKIVKGFLNATGMHHGIGIGNPNAEFMPDVTACSVSSDGSSAKILWGRRDGSVAVMWHPRTMSGSRATAKINASRVEEEHRGAVNDAVFAADGSACVTVGADGVAKVWSLKRFGCVWTSPRGSSHGPEPYVKILENLANGSIICATDKGTIVVYTGIDLSLAHAQEVSQLAIIQHRILPPSLVGQDIATIEQIFLDAHSPTVISLLVRYDNSTSFYRYRVNSTAGLTSVVSFGDPTCGSMRVVLPVFGSDQTERSYVIAGDQLGSVSIYGWDDVQSTDKPVAPQRRIDIFTDAAVTAIATHAFITAVGSSKGSVRIIDTLTLEPLRSFPAPIDHHVRKIILRRDMLIVAAGSRVLAWKGAPVSSKGGKVTKGKGKAKQEYDRKWHKQIELRRDIDESRDDIDEVSSITRLRLGQERAQAEHLSELGLSEREAIEYILMLSREEASKDNRTPFAETDEGVFELDDPDPALSEGSLSSSSSSVSSISVSRSTSFVASSPPLRAVISSAHHTIGSTSVSSVKVQVSPRVIPEPMEAGGLSSSPFSLDSAPVNVQRPPGNADFPSMTPESSRPSSSWGPLFPSTAHGSSRQSAWSTPLRTPPPSSPPAMRRASQSPSVPTSPRVTASRSSDALNMSPIILSPTGALPVPSVSLLSRQAQEHDWEQRMAEIGTIEDEELRFALELSLAEERSRQGA